MLILPTDQPAAGPAVLSYENTKTKDQDTLGTMKGTEAINQMENQHVACLEGTLWYLAVELATYLKQI